MKNRVMEMVVDIDWVDIKANGNPPKSGTYWVICGDNVQRKAVWEKKRGKPGKWLRQGGFTMPSTWGEVQAWKEYDPSNPNDE